MNKNLHFIASKGKIVNCQKRPEIGIWGNGKLGKREFENVDENGIRGFFLRNLDGTFNNLYETFFDDF